MARNSNKLNQSAKNEITAGRKKAFDRMLMRDTTAIEIDNKKRKLSPLDKLVGIYLSDMCMDGRDHSWPSYKLIASECGCSVRAAKSSVKALKEFQYITVEPRFNDGERSSNMYFPAWQAVKSLHPSSEQAAPTPVQDQHPSGEQAAPKTSDGDPSVETPDLKQSAAARASGSSGHNLNSNPAMQARAGNDNWPSDAFEQFWAIYPEKIGKANARQCLEKIATRGDVKFEAVIEGVRRYIRNKPKDRDWCHPSTFITQERWDDEPAASKTDGLTLHAIARAMTKASI